MFVCGAYWWSNLRRQVFALTALALVAVAPEAARAYTNTTAGIVNLNGAVALVCSISINSSGATTTFSNMAQGTAATLIGTVVEICNDVNGYKVTLTTANNANFKGATTNALIPYSLTYNGGSVTFSSGTAILTPGGSRTTSLGVSKALNLTFGSGFYSSDSYDETLTITMIGQ